MFQSRTLRWAIPLALLLVAGGALATTYNSPTVDDNTPPSAAARADAETANPDESWQSDELLVEDPVGDSGWGPFNDLQGLWVTWNESGIYFAVEGALWDAASGIGANSVNLYIDVDYGQDTGIGDLSQVDANALDAITRNFWRPLVIGSDFGCDFGYTSWAGNFDLGFLDITDPQAPINLLTQDLGIVESRATSDNRGYEVYVPWEVFYPDQPAGRVPSGTRMALVVAQVGGGDSLSPESIPDGADDRIIETPLIFTVDGDGNGIPDQEWPPAGTVSGTLTLPDPEDTTTRIDIVAYQDGQVSARTSVTGSGDYTLNRLGPGAYEIGIETEDCYVAPQQSVTLTDSALDVTGIDFQPVLIDSGMDTQFFFVDGDQAITRTYTVESVVYDAEGDEVDRYTTLATDPSSHRFDCLLPGEYEIVSSVLLPEGMSGPSGYKTARTMATVVDGLYSMAPSIELRLVQPVRLSFRAYSEDAVGEEIRALRFPQSVPEEDFFVRGIIEIAAVDEDGDEALLEPLLEEIDFGLTSIDPRFPALGTAIQFWTLEDDDTAVADGSQRPTLAQLSPVPRLLTRATFRLSNDTREVLRLRADHAVLDSGDLEIRVTPRLPTEMELSIDSTDLITGEGSAILVQLLDVIGNESFTPGIEVSFEVTPDAQGQAAVLPSEVLTDSEGRVGATGAVQFSSTVVDTFSIRAVANNGIEEIFSNTVDVIVVPGPPQRLALTPGITGIDRVEVAVRLVDAFGATIAGTPVEFSITAGPDELLADGPVAGLLDQDGSARLVFTLRSGLTGVLQVATSAPSLPSPTSNTTLQLLPGLAAFDEFAPETDEDHNADPGIDLTAMAVWIEDDFLNVTLPFNSAWDGAHVVLLIETNEDAEGAFSDAFAFPVNFGHTLLPDYVCTYKYFDNSYGDLRRPNGPPGSWEWYNWTTEEWAGEFQEGVQSTLAGTATRTASEVAFKVPVALLKTGFAPGFDSVRLQAYVTQEANGNKTPALDSVPHDATHDMLPEAGNWYDDLSVPTTLTEYVEVVPVVLGDDLTLEDVTFAPTLVTQGDEVLLTARPVLAPGTVSSPVLQVFADLTRLGGSALVPMSDKGSAGDVTAGDGLFSALVTVPSSLFAGDYIAQLQALELSTSQKAFAEATLAVEGEPELVPLIAALDVAGDDHGPNQEGVQFLFYEYPTSGVFFDGVFDLRGLEVFDVGDSLLFRITLTDLTNPAEPGAADWAAVYPSDSTCPAGSRVDLNLQNIVILLDTVEGNNVGSTGLPTNRYAEVAPQDAWEYAMVFDGWWKGLVKSQGSNAASDWETLPEDSAWFFCANDRTNTIDGFLGKSQLTPEDLDRIARWDIIVMISGHDGDSNRDNWGGVRWTNEGRSQEWQFGGGRNGEDNRERDANIMDILSIAGTDAGGAARPQGRPQEVQLDYLRDEALLRFGAGETAVLLEATEFIDETPPDVRIRGITADRAVVPWEILTDSPVVIRADIFDAAGLDDATLYWRAPGEPESARREVPMGQLRADLEPNGTEWVADIRWSDIEEATSGEGLSDPTGLTDAVRFILVEIEATDRVGNSTLELEGRDAEVLELPLSTVDTISYRDILRFSDGSSVLLDLNDGSRVVIPETALRAVAGDDPDPTFDLVLGALPQDGLDFSYRGEKNTTILADGNRYLGVARELRLTHVTEAGPVVVDVLPEPVELSLHFPRYLLDDEHPGELQLFRWVEATSRWLLKGGHGERGGTTVTTLARDLGVWAAFTRSSEIDTGQLVTGLQLSPNPFSPNGDGLYDELDITYVLPFETDSSVLEVFDVRGTRVRILRLFEGDGVTNRTLGLSWDGKDENGREVPMGIYIVRVEVKEKNSTRVERATQAVAVVR